jgi:hypothetical protein
MKKPEPTKPTPRTMLEAAVARAILEDFVRGSSLRSLTKRWGLIHGGLCALIRSYMR